MLRPAEIGDIKPVFDCWMQDEEVSGYMYRKATGDIEEAKSFAEFELSDIENNLWNRWIIVNREENNRNLPCVF